MFYWYTVVVSILLFKTLVTATITSQGVVYHTAEELANLHRANVETGTDLPQEKYTPLK